MCSRVQAPASPSLHFGNGFGLLSGHPISIPLCSAFRTTANQHSPSATAVEQGCSEPHLVLAMGLGLGAQNLQRRHCCGVQP